jgi:hypothetical protein
MAVYVFGLDKPHDRAACTNGKGQYSIERLEPGRYVACLAHNGVFGLCHDFTVREAQKEKNDFHLTAFRQTDEEALLNRLPPGSRLGPGSPFASLDGRVFDETGAPVGGIEVHLERTDWGRTPQRFKTTTDAQGRFSFAVFSGEYVVGVQHKGKIGLLRAFTLRSRRQVLTDFDLNHFPPG